MEFVQFNMSVILSQQYDILADIAEEMAEIYKKSEDLDLMELYYSYTNMGVGIRSLSELVKEKLGEYDWQILESLAVMEDVIVNGNGGGGDPPPPPPPPPPVGCFGGDPGWDCFWCEVAVMTGTIIACIILIIFFPYAGEACVELLEIFHITGSSHITCEIFGCC